MKFSSNNNSNNNNNKNSNNKAVLRAGLLLTVLLAAFPTTTAVATAIKASGITGESGNENGAAYSRGVASRRLADCTEEDFLVTGFVISEDGSNSTETAYEGCYEVADTLDDDLELSFYKIDGDLTVAGGAFYASDNFGGNPEPAWYFGDVAADTSAQNATASFLCFDLDLNAAADTHPADVTTWGIIRDEDSSVVSRECNITITCGCSAEAPTPASVDDDDTDDDAAVEEATNGGAASAISTGGARFVLVLSSIVLVVLSWW